MPTDSQKWTPQVGDIVGWANLPDGDELEITNVFDRGGFLARRGHAEAFVFNGRETPAPYLIERPER